jgi:hypothetical protein
MKYIVPFFLIVLIACDNPGNTPPEVPPRPFYEGVISDEIDGVPFTVYISEERSFFCAFKGADINGNEYDLQRSSLPFPDVFADSDGNFWNVFGESMADAEKKLLPINNLVGYWFVFPSFHKKIVLYDGTEINNPSFGTENPLGEWLVDSDFVREEALKDGIKSIDDPKFIGSSLNEFESDFFYAHLPSDELLTLVKVGDEIKIYPHRILDYHGIVNDVIDGQPVAISYSPLTGTSRAWSRVIEGQTDEFGGSGLVFNNNLILYDRTTDSHWSQIFNKAVNGTLIGTEVPGINVYEISLTDVIETTEGKAKLLSSDTGFEDDYQHSLFGAYHESAIINYPLQFSDNSIPIKERVIGVTVGETTKVYRMSDVE